MQINAIFMGTSISGELNMQKSIKANVTLKVMRDAMRYLRAFDSASTWGNDFALRIKNMLAFIVGLYLEGVCIFATRMSASGKTTKKITRRKITIDMPAAINNASSKFSKRLWELL